MLFQEHEHKLSKAESLDSLFKRIYDYLVEYDTRPPQMLFKFVDYSTKQSSACERAVKSFLYLEPLLQIGEVSQSGSQLRSISNISSEITVGGKTLYLSDRIDCFCPKEISAEVIASILEGVPRRFPFDQILIVFSNVQWQKDRECVAVKQVDETRPAYNITIAKHDSTLARLDGIFSLVQTEVDGDDKLIPLSKELAGLLESIGKVNNKLVKTWSFEPRKLPLIHRLSAADQIKARDLAQEIRGHLTEIYKQRKFPHYLEDWVVLRKWERFDEQGQRHYKPERWVPIECVMPPKGSELPTSLSSRMDQKEHQRMLAHGWIEPLDGGAQVIVDGVVCDVWPYIPEPKKSIPRKKIILGAFKPHGYVEVETGSGTLEIAKKAMAACLLVAARNANSDRVILSQND